MLPPPAVPRQTAPAATPETIEVQVPPGAVPGSTLEFELDDGRTIDVTVPEGARAGDPLQVPLSLAAAAPPAESIEMQEELRADARAAEATGPTAAERSATPGRTAERSAPGKQFECIRGFIVFGWFVATLFAFPGGFKFTYTFEAAFNIHHLLADKAFSTSAIICFVCLLLSVLFGFSWMAVGSCKEQNKCGGVSERISGKHASAFLSLIALLYCVAFGFAVHARIGLDDEVEDYCERWGNKDEEIRPRPPGYCHGCGWDCDKEVKNHLLLYLDFLLSCTAINAALTAALALICWLDLLSDKPVPSDGPSDAVDVESGAGTRTSIEGEETVLDGEVVTSPASSENVVEAEPWSPSISFWAAGLVAAAGARARRALSPREPEAQEGAESPVPPPPPPPNLSTTIALCPPP